MREVTSNNFGILIAYLVPGFTALWGVSYFSVTVRTWLTGTSTDGPTIGGFLYVTLAAIAAGMTVSTVRWAVIDLLHHRTGVQSPNWNYGKLQKNLSAYSLIVEHQYRFYQFYSNMLVALFFLYGARRIRVGVVSHDVLDLGCLFLIGVFYAGSRDTLRKYYSRVQMILGKPRSNRRGS